MGCDGGTIPRRDELVRVKKKAETKDKESELNFQWRCCAITQQPLQEPIVACHLGKLCNKESVINALLDKDTLPTTMRYIKNLKDIKTLNLTKNPAYSEDNDGETNSCAPYICPVIGLEMSGKFRFVALWTCGCVFSERALKEISTKTCHKCQKPFESSDVIVLNGNEEDLVVMKKNMEMRRELQKKNKDKKKIKTEPTEVKPAESTNGAKPLKLHPVATSSTSKDSATVSNGKIKTGNSLPSASTKRPGSLREADERAKKVKPEYSLAKDPQVSDVYKSIFTSHKSEKEQSRAHWVTYNPFYN